MKLSGTCPAVERNGFLKKVCVEMNYRIVGTTSLAVYQCAHSDTLYGGIGYSYSSRYERVCDNDPHSYQACGMAQWQVSNLGHTGPLCGEYICDTGETGRGYSNFTMTGVSLDVLCGRKLCGFRDCITAQGCKNVANLEQSCGITNETEDDPMDEQRPEGFSESKSRLCNGWCDMHYRCDDEAFCGGFVYGMFCNDSNNAMRYVMPKDICDEFSPHYLCANNEDEANCPNLDTLPSDEKCIAHFYPGAEVWIPLLNSTRCTAPFRDDLGPVIAKDPYLIPLCDNYLDQTNCTDPNRFKAHLSFNFLK
jgi:hypothetical protein